jgi:hypothetical protein
MIPYGLKDGEEVKSGCGCFWCCETKRDIKGVQRNRARREGRAEIKRQLEEMKFDFSDYEVDPALTAKHEPELGWCGSCGDTSKLTVYFNEKDNLYVYGCDRCCHYGNPKITPELAQLNWTGKFCYFEKEW